MHPPDHTPKLTGRLLAVLRPLFLAAILISCLSVVLFPPQTSLGVEQEIPPDEMESMIRGIRKYGFRDNTVLEAVRNVPRHIFVPKKHRKYSYKDTPISIGHGQTISQPFIVAEMTRRLNLSGESKVLEIGTGSGYQAAVLAEITDHVYTIEILKPLVKAAGKNLKSAGYDTIQQRHGDGYYGWPDAAPFDAVIVTCAAGSIPPPLVEQLALGGRMIIPVGRRFGTQHLILVTKKMDGTVSSKTLMPVRFVPLVRK